MTPLDKTLIMSINRQLFQELLGLPSLNYMGLEIEKAENIYLYDTDGNRYTDLISGVSVSNLGHRHPAVVSAVKEQLDKYMHLMVYGEFIQSPQVKLAKLLSEQLPAKLNCTYFVNSGSEAIEGAVKLSKRHTGRKEIAAFKNAYHGGTQGALSILGHEKLKNAFRPLLPEVLTLQFNDIDSLEKITRETACVVVETIQAEAGIILPEKGFLNSLRQKCDHTGTLLIIDDIQMGFGRTGKLFSFEHFDVEPDILCLAKAMGGGMPIGAFISSRNLMRSLTSKPELGHITTFGGHPVSCAASLATLQELLKSGLIKQAEIKGKLFKKHISCHPAVKRIRGKGLMLAVEIGDSSLMDKLFSNFLENRLIVDRFLFSENSFRIAPPLVITPDQIDETSERILNSLNNL